ncbi:MAG: hypothetical protein O7B99_14080, partial [Planctomycetota bacterium]|nr:hypothetical protein [Planctomycetota bacterium]
MKLDMPPDAGGPRFGLSVSLRGDRLAIGHPYGGKSGYAYLWEREPFGWGLADIVQASDGGDNDQFGYSVATDGDTLLVGAIGHGPLSAKGKAYVFERGPSGWVETAQLVPSDPLAWVIGFSVDLQGDRALVGAKSSGSLGDTLGRAFVFERGPSGWVETANLISSASAFDDGFGASVALDGDRVVIGAPFHDEGFAVVFELQPGGGWVEQAVLSPPDLADSDWFGRGVAIQGDTVLVGAPAHDEVGINAGAAYVFDLILGQWVQTAKFVPGGPAGFPGARNFGWSVAVDGQHAVVGFEFDDAIATSAGSVYLYHRDASGWSEGVKFFGSALLPGDTFGYDVAIEGAEILVGAPNRSSAGSTSGKAYLFTRDSGASLLGDTASVSVSRGGTQELQLGACPEHAGDTFQMGGTFSGTSPVFLDQGFLVPLNPDPYFFYTLTSPGIPLSPTTGTFDEWGRAYASFTVPPDSQPFLVGLELH